MQLIRAIPIFALFLFAVLNSDKLSGLIHLNDMMSQDEQKKMMGAAGASQTCESLTGGTCMDVQRCLESVWQDSTQIPLLGEKGDKRMTRGEFQRLTGATYVSETHLTPELMFKEWEEAAPYEYERPFEAAFVRQYRSFCENPPVHRLKKVTHDSGGNALVSSPGLGLFSDRAHKVGDLIGEYKGLFTAQYVLNEYALAYRSGKGIDASSLRNEIPQINDGFGNVVLIPGRCIAGLSARDLFAASDDIKAGEQFCWNYGYLPRLKVAFPYAELRPKETRAFIKKHKIADLVQCLEKMGRKKASFAEHVLADKFRYILQTPSVIFLMIFDGTITREIGTVLLETAVTTDCITLEEMVPLMPLRPVAISCIEMRQRLQKELPCLVKIYDRCITSLPARAGVALTFDLATKINDFLTLLFSMNSERRGGIPDGSLLTMWSVLEADIMKDIKTHFEKMAQLLKKKGGAL